MVTSLGPRGTNFHILSERSKKALRNLLCVSVRNTGTEVNDSSNDFGKNEQTTAKEWRLHI